MNDDPITFLWQGFHHIAMIFLPEFLYNLKSADNFSKV